MIVMMMMMTMIVDNKLARSHAIQNLYLQLKDKHNEYKSYAILVQNMVLECINERICCFLRDIVIYHCPE